MSSGIGYDFDECEWRVKFKKKKDDEDTFGCVYPISGLQSMPIEYPTV
jgi:hypothetical protein